MRDAIELFILERRADKKQPSTIRHYRQQLGLFGACLTHQDVPGDGPEDVTKALILAYRLHLQERGHTRLVGQPLQHTTLVASRRALRTFFAWAEEEGYVDRRTHPQAEQDARPTEGRDPSTTRRTPVAVPLMKVGRERKKAR